jgi:serine/threonine-protein kinase
MTSTLPRQVDHYRLEEKLGAGGMGVVYRATDTLLDRPVALKMLHAPADLGGTDVAEAQGRFLREAKAAARIRSRHVAQVLQLGTTAEGDAYIVMEFLQGETLSRLLARVGRLPAARVVAIGRQICRGMQAAHELGIVHRDLKPANVMLVQDEGEEIAKVLDFGVAKLTNDGQGKELTQTGALVGTLPFMAPEQLMSAPVDNRTDVYALGIMLYRMLTGAAVWEAHSLADIVRHQMMSAPPAMISRVTNPDFSDALDAVVLRCLEKTPEKRWQSMRELGDALEAALRASSVLPATLVTARSPADALFDDEPAAPASRDDGVVWRGPAVADGVTLEDALHPTAVTRASGALADAVAPFSSAPSPPARPSSSSSADLCAPSGSSGPGVVAGGSSRRGVMVFAAAATIACVAGAIVAVAFAFRGQMPPAVSSGPASLSLTADTALAPSPSSPSLSPLPAALSTLPRETPALAGSAPPGEPPRGASPTGASATSTAPAAPSTTASAATPPPTPAKPSPLTKTPVQAPSSTSQKPVLPATKASSPRLVTSTTSPPPPGLPATPAGGAEDNAADTPVEKKGAFKRVLTK